MAPVMGTQGSRIFTPSLSSGIPTREMQETNTSTAHSTIRQIKPLVPEVMGLRLVADLLAMMILFLSL